MENSPWCSFTKQQLCAGKDSEELKYETQCRRSAADLLQESGKSLGLPQLTIATALVYFQRFFVRHSYRDYDKEIVALTCMFLAGKVEETPKKLNEIIEKTASVRKQKLTEEKKTQLREKVLFHEFVLLSTIDFELKVEHPYSFIVKYVKSLEARKDIAQYAWNFVNDSLRSTTLCLQYRPQLIAASSILLAAKFCDYPLPEGSKPWWKFIDSSFSKEVLEDIGNQILDLYENSPIVEAIKSGTYSASDKNQPKSSEASQHKEAASVSTPENRASERSESDARKPHADHPRSPRKRSDSPHLRPSPKRQRHISPHSRSRDHSSSKSHHSHSSNQSSSSSHRRSSSKSPSRHHPKSHTDHHRSHHDHSRNSHNDLRKSFHDNQKSSHEQRHSHEHRRSHHEHRSSNEHSSHNQRSSHDAHKSNHDHPKSSSEARPSHLESSKEQSVSRDHADTSSSKSPKKGNNTADPDANSSQSSVNNREESPQKDAVVSPSNKDKSASPEIQKTQENNIQNQHPATTAGQ